MALTEGTKLGPYVIESPAGAGGMGEVYKAKDTRLDRSVAIKVLPTLLATDSDMRQRFDREAKAISSLNHPNICTLHDVGHQDGIDYLVMEYLDGETLAVRLDKGALPVPELLSIAIQIADALDKAHRQGLVHRDLKPGNIMLTKAGAKLMDFGLAKLQLVGGVVQGTSGLTRTSPLTGAGMIVGTLQYMSPEQLEGKESDARSDIFSFGAILYEMATGKRAFEGTSQASLIASILKEEPRPISQQTPLSPPMLERVVQQCLAKDPEHRWQAAGDLKRALQWITEGGSQAGIPIPVSARRKVRERALWGAVAVMAAALAAIGILYFTRTVPVTKVARFVVPTPAGLTSVSWPRLSPDGSLIAFIALDSAGQSGIYLRPLNSLDAHLLAQTQSNVSRPFWSPDSKQLAYFENNQLKKISVAGGLAQLVCEAAFGSDGSWGSGGVIVFDGQRTDSIRQVSASGGTPAPASRIDHSHGEHMSGWPSFLPDGEHFLYLGDRDSSTTDWTLKAGSVRTLEATTLATVNSRAEYINGYLLYVRNGLLVAQPFDPDKLRMTGEAVPLSGNVASQAELALFSASSDGTMIFQRGQAGGLNTIVSVNRRGDSLIQIGKPGRLDDFALSPDNSRLAYGLVANTQNSVDVWVRDLKRDVDSRLTFGPGNNVWPIWNHDGSKVLYTSNRTGGHWRIMQRSANGTGADELVFAIDSADLAVTDVSRDGSLYVIDISKANEDLWTYNTLTKKIEPLLTQPYQEQRGVISPDGKLLAYQSDEAGNAEVYIRELTPSGGKWQVSTTHGRAPRWRADGKELFYITTEDFSFMAVPISYDKSLEIGTPVKLFTHRFVYNGSQTLFPYAVTNDGKRFYILSPADQGNRSEFVIVQNWSEELKK